MQNIAIVGYNNTLAKNILELMSLRGYDENNIKIYADNVQKNTIISFGETELKVDDVKNLKTADFSAIIFTDSEKTATTYIPKFAKENIRIINATKAFTGENDIPVIVGGINESSLEKAVKNTINVPHPYVVEFLSAIV